MNAGYTADVDALLTHAGWLRRFARALVGNADDAEDLAQDTLVTAWQKPSDGGRAWLRKVARNLAVDRFRGNDRRQRREEAAQDASAGRAPTPEELLGDAQVHRHVAEAVTTLAEPFRQTLVLRFYEGMSSAEIARKLREPEGTIRWRVKEGLDRVRRALDARYGHDRSAWVSALAPLLPKHLDGLPVPRVRPLGRTARLPAGLHLSTAMLGLLTLAGISIVKCMPRKEHRVAEIPSASTEVVPAAVPAPPVRLDLPKHASPPPDTLPELPPGPGSADAKSLVEELVLAIQGNDYDAFVAKGAAHFRLAVGTASFAHLSEKLTGRLTQGHRVTTLGSVRRPEHIDWAFKIEFSDDGDDALVTLVMDGWQVAGFLFNPPFPMPEESSR